MPVQSFNDSFLGNADVPQTGSPSGSNPPAVGGRAVGMPAAVRQSDGVENLRAEGSTKQANPLSTPSSNRKFWPSAVDKYNGESV